MTTSDSIVIIPTYNEKENIEKIIRAINKLDKQFHILVIDDGSPDGTAAIVKRLMADEFAGGLLDRRRISPPYRNIRSSEEKPEPFY